MSHKSFLIFIASFYSILGFAECSAQMTQLMKPTHPDTNYQGFATVKFDINRQGIPKKIKAIKSECAMGRDDKGKIILKKCPFFKSSAVNAAKYLRYKPPVDEAGKSCEIKETTFEYKFSLYNVKLDYDDFIIRDDYANRDSGFSETMTNYSINQVNLTGENPPLTQKAAAIENAKP
jgi:hypothetical protein